jgi:hypothetical protein
MLFDIVCKMIVDYTYQSVKECSGRLSIKGNYMTAPKARTLRTSDLPYHNIAIDDYELITLVVDSIVNNGGLPGQTSFYVLDGTYPGQDLMLRIFGNIPTDGSMLIATENGQFIVNNNFVINGGLRLEPVGINPLPPRSPVHGVVPTTESFITLKWTGNVWVLVHAIGIVPWQYVSGLPFTPPSSSE